jgi:hypothetical protein
MSQGVMWDDNINSGPELDSYQVLGGTLIPGRMTAELKNEASVSNVAGNLLFVMGDSKGFMWNTALSFYNKAHFVITASLIFCQLMSAPDHGG